MARDDRRVKLRVAAKGKHLCEDHHARVPIAQVASEAMRTLDSRPTAPFIIFYRTASGHGGYSCHACATHRQDAFRRLADVCAVASQHLNVCRAQVRHRPVEGTAIVDGETHGVVLREGVMILALHTVFAACPSPMRVIV